MPPELLSAGGTTRSLGIPLHPGPLFPVPDNAVALGDTGSLTSTPTRTPEEAACRGRHQQGRRRPARSPAGCKPLPVIVHAARAAGIHRAAAA